MRTEIEELAKEAMERIEKKNYESEIKDIIGMTIQKTAENIFNELIDSQIVLERDFRKWNKLKEKFGVEG